MKNNRMKDALENIAQRNVPENLNIWPQIAAKVERKNFMQTVRTRPAFALLLVLLALALLSSVAYAIGKAAGYIPGIGLFDQDTSLRVLAEPVTVTRDGIMLTVEQVVLSSDKTVVVYKVEGIPEDAYESEGADQNVSSISPVTEETDENTNSFSSSIVVPLDGTPGTTTFSVDSANTCFPDENLLLPDGTLLPLQSGEGNGWVSGFENRHVFGPVPMEVNKVSFLLSCIQETVPGKLPQDWEVPLQLVSAPPALKIFPAAELTKATTRESQNALILERVIETDDGYILIGKFRSIGLPEHAVAQGERRFSRFTDANGQTIQATHVNGMDNGDGKFGEFGLAYEIKGKQHAWPLTLTVDDITVLFYQQTTQFEFDTGPNPEVGQTWILKPDVQLMGYTIHEIAIKRTKWGYAFTIKSDPDVIMVSPEIKDFPASNAGGGGDGFGRGETYFQLNYKDDPPSGKLTIEFGWLQAIIHGPWQVQWSPENILPGP